MAHTHVILQISAPNDRNGNPRRGFAVIRLNGRYAECFDWADGGYPGTVPLAERFPQWETAPMISVRVGVSEFRTWKEACLDARLKREEQTWS